MFNIVLLMPKIPQNTGTIGRTCVSVGARLHVVGPTPIDFEEKKLRRAGMDYWPRLDFNYWESLETFLAAHPVTDRHFFFTTKSRKPYFQETLKPGDFLWFGSEDSGLPEALWRAHENQALTMPMKAEFRSLNLANAVSIALYEGIRQNYDPALFR